MLDKTRKYEFDAALSFAGEDREHAVSLAKALKARGYSVFYDKDFRGELWGKRQHEYEEIYGPKSKFVIPFVSQYYARKDWPRFEFDSAKREARTRATEFLLPIQIDDARLLGLGDDVNYLRLGELTIREIASEFARKCGRPEGSRRSSPERRKTSQSKNRIALLLSSEARLVVGLITTSVLPMPISKYKQLFPDLDWSAHCRRFSRYGLITISKGRIIATKCAKDCFDDESETLKLHKQWISHLVPFNRYIDTAAVLAIHHLTAGSLDDFVNTLADVVETTSLGDWNRIYLTALQTLAQKNAARRLSGEGRCRLYNSLGLCFSHSSEYRQALAWFCKLGTASASSPENGWIGQSLVNRGVAYFNLGERDRAARYYRKAIAFGQKVGDDTLVARAKGNLAQQVRSTAPAEAAELLNDSLETKKKHGDEAGLAIVYAQLGQLKAILGQPKAGIQYLIAAKTIAQKLGLRETLALTLHDLGSALSSSGKAKTALQYYRRAHRIASQDGYLQTQILTAASEGRLCFELGRYEEALAAFRRVIRVSEVLQDRAGLICGLHAVGVILRLRGRTKLGHDHLVRAQRLARDAQDEGWVTRCVIDECRRVVKGACSGFDRPALRQAALREQRRHDWPVAARIWEIYADENCRADAHPRTIRQAFLSSSECYEKARGRGSEQTEVLTKLYVWLWQQHEYPGSIEALAKAESVGRAGHRMDLVMRIVDQRGVCLQEIGRYDDAKRDHLRALRLARKERDEEQIIRSLNNLGEAFRKLGRYTLAARSLEESQKIALDHGDIEGALVAAENRALVLVAQGDNLGTAKLLTWCRRIALKGNFWGSAINALARLGEMAWEQGDMRNAKKLFRRALTEGTRHNQKKSTHRIALNYSRLLLNQGQALLAARVLPQWQAAFLTEPDAYLFHYTLGEIYQNTQDLDSAETQWRLGQSSAEAFGDNDYIAMCAAKLAEVYEEQHLLTASEQELRIALQNEPEAMGRALLLLQLLRIQLAAGNSKAAEKTFVEARTIAAENKMEAVTIDVHVAIAKYYWELSSRAKLNSLKAFTVAMLTALQIGPDSYGSLVADFLIFVTRARGVPSEQLLARLAKNLEGWVAKSITSDPTSVDLIMWPVTVVKKLLPFTRDRQKLKAELSRLLSTGGFLPRPRTAAM